MKKKETECRLSDSINNLLNVYYYESQISP
jgi:hypothetical protein